MKISEKIEKATFIKRPNRFIAKVYINDKELTVHVPNTGRCKEIFIEDAKVILRKLQSNKRKTEYDLISVWKEDKLINIDSQMPNRIVYEALIDKKIKKLSRYNEIEKEKTFQNSRFDFRLSNDLGEKYYLEVKGVTLEENYIAKFPDAPTERGTKHVRELIKAKEEGYGAGILFLIQLQEVDKFTPNKEMDKVFYNAIIDSRKAGVDLFAYNCVVFEDEITLKDEIELDI